MLAGAVAIRCSGYTITAAIWRRGLRRFNRASAMSSAADSAEKISRRANGVGPVLKNGGGWCSIRAVLTTRTLVVRKNAAQPFDLLECLARTAHHAGQRVLGDDHRQPGLL